MLTVGLAQPVQAAPVDPVAPVSPPLSYTVGNALARSAGRLHAVWVSDCPPPKGACATDHGPHVGVFWQRASLGGGWPPNWSSPRRISPPKVHAGRPAIGADDGLVAVAWVSAKSYLHPRARDPRSLFVRVSTDQGGSWKPNVRLSKARGRVDYPVVAVADGQISVVWTDANNGRIRIARSDDAGASWTKATIGTTSSGRGEAGGFRGFPAIGASGTNAAVAWFANPAGRQLALTSAAHGDDWTASSVPAVLTGPSPNNGARYPAVRGADDGESTRVAIAYTTSEGLAARVWDGAALSSEAAVAGPWPDGIAGRSYGGAFGPAVAPFGTDGLLVSWAGCRRRAGLAQPCAPSKEGSRIDLLARATEDGTSWGAGRAVSVADKRRNVREAPSLVSMEPTRPVLFLSRASNWSKYAVVIQRAS